jgi:hypothetical protein
MNTYIYISFFFFSSNFVISKIWQTFPRKWSKLVKFTIDRISKNFPISLLKEKWNLSNEIHCMYFAWKEMKRDIKIDMYYIGWKELHKHAKKRL